MKKSALSNEAARQAQERTSPWKRPRLWRELAVIFLGSLLFAASMNCIVLPTGMYSGGFLGLAQLLRMGLESLVPGLQSLGDLAGAIYFLLNLPLLAIAWSRFGHYFLGKTIACVLFYSVLLAVIPIPEVGVFDEVLTACVIGGLLCGAGAGLTLTAGCSGGGEEILGLLCAMKNPWFSVGRISMLLNIGVFGTGLFLFDRAVGGVQHSHGRGYVSLPGPGPPAKCDGGHVYHHQAGGHGKTGVPAGRPRRHPLGGGGRLQQPGDGHSAHGGLEKGGPVPAPGPSGAGPNVFAIICEDISVVGNFQKRV